MLLILILFYFKGSPLKDQRVSLEVKVKRKLLSQLDKQMVYNNLNFFLSCL
jgi:hypothetical protein